ncbi:MAG: hypothetical protein ACU4F9_10825 [Arcticibacter sp.]
MKNILSIAFLFSLSVLHAQAQHQLVLKNGESMSGEIRSLNDGVIKFIYKGKEMSYKTSEISNISFGLTDNGPSSASSTSTTKGVSFVMAGRKLIREPKIDNLTMEKGIVVVEITIDKYGNVVKAVPGIEGTTTTSNYLLTKAKQAAESVKFDTSPVMPQSQTGSITITF